MTITVAHITPLVALIAGILILIMPRLLELHRRDLSHHRSASLGLNSIHHFIR